MDISRKPHRIKKASSLAPPVVEARAITKKFGNRLAVDHLDLDVPARVCFGLLGPNGAGKTTTLRMIYGVTRATSGTIRVFGMDIAHHVRAVRSRLGVTLQQNVLIEALSPKENLLVFGRYHLLREPESRKFRDFWIPAFAGMTTEGIPVV